MLLTGLLLVALIGGTGDAESAAPVGPDLDAIDRFVAEEVVSQPLPGLALAITQGDRILLLKGYGTTDRGPITPKTQFMIASVSKSFTALAVMQQVERGKIDLDSPIRSYLPDFTLPEPGAADRITVRHLLNRHGLDGSD